MPHSRSIIIVPRSIARDMRRQVPTMTWSQERQQKKTWPTPSGSKPFRVHQTYRIPTALYAIGSWKLDQLKILHNFWFTLDEKTL